MLINVEVPHGSPVALALLVLELGVLVVRVHSDNLEDQVNVLDRIHGITLEQRRATGRHHGTDRGRDVGIFQKPGDVVVAEPEVLLYGAALEKKPVCSRNIRVRNSTRVSISSMSSPSAPY